MFFRAISYPLRKEAGEFPVVSEDLEVIADRIKQMLLTGKSERVMRPLFGSNLKRYLFENKIFAKKMIKSEIRNVLNEDDDIVLQNIDINWSNEFVDITVFFNFKGVDAKLDFSFNKETL